MIDYYETKSQPITRVMVWQAYWKVRANRGGMGIDNMSWDDLEKDRNRQLYKLWNRLSSGSYFPPPVKEVEIKKKGGGTRKLGIPTILDRIAQEVVKAPLEQIVEPLFHDSSYGYRKGRDCHQAVDKAMKNAFNHDWAIDLDIKGYFDTIDHDMLLKAVKHYCKQPWILMYVTRWLKAGVLKTDGTLTNREVGTPQGGVISPLLSNIYLHVVFDKWMEKNHPEKPFERYADDVIVHCKTEKQAIFVKTMIDKRMTKCKLQLHPGKTKIVNLRGTTEKHYPRKLDFLGFSIRLQMVTTKAGRKLMPTIVISQKSKSGIMEKLRQLKIHKMRTSIEAVSRKLSPIIRGLMNYYCKFWSGHTRIIWHYLNLRLSKWVRWEKGLSTRVAVKWLTEKYRAKPGLFPHWELVHP
jgi:group II intron reverse transcriptase/maturase